MLQTGSLAPSFQLPDQDGKTVRLQDLAGRWVVLYFYPRDDTPGCTVEACEFTAAKPAFAGLDAMVFGCSADSAASHQKFVAKYGLGIGLLTDADRAVMKQYGAWGKKLMYGKQVEGVIRSTVVIAPDGRVAYHWAKVKAEGHAEQVRAKLAELQGSAGAPAAKAPKAKGAAKKAGKVARPPRSGKAAAAKAAAKGAAKKKVARTAPGKAAKKKR